MFMPDFKKTLKIIDCWIRNVNYKIYLQVFGVMTFLLLWSTAQEN